MTALERVQRARKNLENYIHNERANLLKRSVTDDGAIEVLEHTRKTIQMMYYLGVITEAESEFWQDEGLLNAFQTNEPIALAPITEGHIHDFDLQTTPEPTLKKWWRARLTATGTKLMKEYQQTTDNERKHTILSVFAAGMEAGGLVGALSTSERMQIALLIHKHRKEIK